MSHSVGITAQHLSFAFDGGSPVLTDLSFDILPGEYVGIIGPNGGGKTTLLKLILGLLRPISGSILIGGLEPQEARQHGHIGYVPQRAAQTGRQFPATVLEVVRSGLVSSGGRKSDAEALERALQLVQIADLKYRLIDELSGGQRQRVFIARSLVSRPGLLILDEPATGVDVPSRDDFYTLLQSLHHDDGLTILFVTHDIDAIAREVDRVLCLNQTLCSHASPREYMEKHFLQEAFSHAHV